MDHGSSPRVRILEFDEYESRDVFLEAAELEGLLALETRPVDLTPTGTPGWYTLKAKWIVGTVVLPTLRLLIRPKVSLQNLFFLLGYGWKLVRWGHEHFPYERDVDLVVAMGRIFESEVRAAASRGLARAYQARQEPLQTLRGRIDFATQLGRRQGLPLPLECRYEEYCEDTELNRILRAAHHRLLQLPQLPGDLALGLHGTMSFFSGVTDVSYPRFAVPVLRLDRLTRHWEPALRLAEMILRQEVLRDAAGEVRGLTFTVNMNELFEKFVSRVVQQEAARSGWSLTEQAPRNLSTSVALIPDLVVVHAGRDCAVGDVKYKELRVEGFRHADLYQMLAYCVALGLPRGLLIYAGEGPTDSHHVERAGVVLEQVRVDLSGRPEEVLASARDAAQRLLQHAGAFSPDMRS